MVQFIHICRKCVGVRKNRKKNSNFTCWCTIDNVFVGLTDSNRLLNIVDSVNLPTFKRYDMQKYQIEAKEINEVTK